MSYIQYKEKVFSKRECLSLTSILKTKISGRMKCVTSLTDPRAWSLDSCLQRKYFLDNFASNASSSSGPINGEDFPLQPPKSQGKKRLSLVAKAVKLRLLRKKDKSTEQLMNRKNPSLDLEEKLAEANDKINKLVSDKEQMIKTSQEHQLEVDNMRTLVHDIQEELCFLHSLKAENSVLKAKLNNDVYKKFSEAQDEIKYLNLQLQIYKDYKCKYENLRTCNNQLKEQYDQINLSLREMEWNNNKLQNEIESLKVKFSGLQSRELVSSNAIVDKKVLRERLQMKEEKISCLVTFLEEQELTIQDLVLQLQRMTSNITAKEGVVGRQISSLKCSLYEKSTRISELEDKLHASELLIRELENLRDHFRLSNCALTDNMQNYKKQFNTVVSCSKKLLSKIEMYRNEAYEKDLQIKKLSIFPQSALTFVYFAQLLNILTESENFLESNEQNVVSFIPVMRRIVEKLKGEIVGDRIEYPLFEMYDSYTQTELLGTDKSIQNEHLCIEHKFVDVSLPDKYYFDYKKSQTEIAKLNEIIERLKESFHRVDSKNHSLEKKIISSITEKSEKEKEIFSLQCQLCTANEHLQLLKNEIEQNDVLLRKLLCEIELEKEAYESTSEIFVATLDTTAYEYEKYTKVLETHLNYKEEKIQFLENYLCNENNYEEVPENDYISLLENEIKNLFLKYVNEKKNVKDLNNQITKLQAALSEKMDHFKIVQEKLLRAEQIFEHLNSIENQCMIKYIKHPEEVAKTEEMDTSSGKILSHSEKLRSHLKEEKNFKEKLESIYRKSVLNLIQRNSIKKKLLKRTIIQMKNNVSRIKCILLKLRKKLKLSESINTDYGIRLSQMYSYNTAIEKERDSMKEQLNFEKSKIANLEKSIEMKCLEVCNLKEKKNKLENILIKIIKQLEKKIACLQDVTKQSKAVSTEFLLEKQENEVSGLKKEIKELTTQNNSLLTQIVNLEERLANILYIPQKEGLPQTLSVEIQTELFDDSKIINTVQAHYENIIQILQEEKTMEKENIEKQHINNLHKIRERCREEIKNLRKTHYKQLIKAEVLHREEIKKITLLHQDQTKDLVNKDDLEYAHQQELEKQKSYFEILLKNKDTEEAELNKGIEELKEEVDKIREQKKRDDLMLSDKIKGQLLEVKKKFKKHYKKLKKSYETKMSEVKNKCINEIKKQRSEYNDSKLSVECQTITTSVQNSDMLTNKMVPVKETRVDKENLKENIRHTLCNKKIGINFEERIKCTIKEANGLIPKEILHILNRFRKSDTSILTNNPDYIKSYLHSTTVTPRVSEKYNLVIKKAEKIKANFQEMLKNISSYHKHAAEENAVIQEIKQLLNHENVSSCSVNQRLCSENKRDEKLKAKKDELEQELVSLKKHLADVEYDLHLERGINESLKKSLISMKINRKTSEQLEMSLERLRTKLEKAVECEKRLSEELERDKKTSERIQLIIQSNKLAGRLEVMDIQEAVKVTEDESIKTQTNIQDSVEVTKDVEETAQSTVIIDSPQFNAESTQDRTSSKTDLNITFIQRCGFLHQWRV